MGNHFSSASLDEATVAMIKKKTRMKSSEITNWYNELKVRREKEIFVFLYIYIYKFV